MAVLLPGAAEARRWVAGCSIVAWRSPGQKQTMSACPRPGVRRGPLLWSGSHPCRPLLPCALVGVVRALSGVRSHRGSPRLRQRCGEGWAHARAGSKAHVGGWDCSTATRGKVAAWSSGAAGSCAMRGLASPALRGGLLRGPAVGRESRQRRAPAGPGQRRGDVVLPGGCPRHGGATRPPSRGPAPRQSAWSTAHQA